MRLILSSAAMLLLAACGATPKPVATATLPPPPAQRERGDLIGLDANELAMRFGAPRLQVREGVGTKLQFAGGACLLDAFLYPGVGGGTPHVLHVDTRSRDGRTVDQAPCIAMIETR
jgi:hypothetical protein